MCDTFAMVKVVNEQLAIVFRADGFFLTRDEATVVKHVINNLQPLPGHNMKQHQYPGQYYSILPYGEFVSQCPLTFHSLRS
jgi:hypothetical protein